MAVSQRSPLSRSPSPQQEISAAILFNALSSCDRLSA
jgi:hypothetical protein